MKERIRRKSDVYRQLRRISSQTLLDFGPEYSSLKHDERLSVELLVMLKHFGAEKAAVALQKHGILTIYEATLLSEDEVRALCGKDADKVLDMVSKYLKGEAKMLNEVEEESGDDDEDVEVASPLPVRERPTLSLSPSVTKRRNYRGSVFESPKGGYAGKPLSGYLKKVTLPSTEESQGRSLGESASSSSDQDTYCTTKTKRHLILKRNCVRQSI